MLSVTAGVTEEAASMVADRAARGRGSVAPWESMRNSWEATGSGPGTRGKKRYDVRSESERSPPPRLLRVTFPGRAMLSEPDATT